MSMLRKKDVRIGNAKMQRREGAKEEKGRGQSENKKRFHAFF
jgi:hypothetical protein